MFQLLSLCPKVPGIVQPMAQVGITLHRSKRSTKIAGRYLLHIFPSTKTAVLPLPDSSSYCESSFDLPGPPSPSETAMSFGIYAVINEVLLKTRVVSGCSSGL